MPLSVNRLIKVTLTINPLASPSRGFGTLLIIGDSDAIPSNERFRSYTNINDVAQDFGVDSEEYKAAMLYYSQSPAPTNLMIARWNQTAAPSELRGAILSSAEKDISQWTSITNGTFAYRLNNNVVAVEGLNFSGQSNINGIADIINSRLSDVKLQWDGERFILTTLATGAEQKLGYLEPVAKQQNVHEILGLSEGIATPANGSDLIPGSPEKQATAGKLVGTSISSQLATLKQVTDGSLKLTVDGSELDVTKLNFSTANSLENVATILTSKLDSKAVATYTSDHLTITSNTTGAQSSVGSAKAGTITTPAADATHGTFTGGIISDESGQLSTLKAITSGTLTLALDSAVSGTECSAINLSGISQMNEVPVLIQAQLSGTTVTYTPSKQFVVTSNTTGKTSKVVITAGSDAALFNALKFDTGESTTGKDAVVGTDNQLHTKLGLADGSSVNGTDFIAAVDEVPATSGKLVGGKHSDLNVIKAIKDGNFNITIDSGLSQNVNGLDFTTIDSLEDIAVAIGSKLRNAQVSAVGDVLVITSLTQGSSSKVSYAKAAELDEKDISQKLKMTKDTGIAPTDGLDAESPLQAVKIMCDRTADWYGCTFAASTMPTDEQLVDIAQFIEANTDTTRIFGITATDTRTLDKEYTEDIASKCKELGLNRTVIQYSQNPYAICSFLGRAFTVNFNGNLTTITMMYKSEPNVEAEDLTETQAQTLADKRCNVFVKYNNDTSIIQNGVMSGDYYFDERHGADWLQDYVQNNLWNYVYSSTTKIGQDDNGINSIISNINNSLSQAFNNGFIGAGVWNGEGFGQLKQGQYLSNGFYVYAPPMSTQTQADRDMRISVPIQVAAKLLGAIHSFDVSITLNR